MPAPWFAYGYGKITQGFPKHSFGGKGTCRCSSWGPRGSHNQSLWCRELETQTIWHHFLLLVFHKMESSLNLGCPTLSNYRRCSFLICLLQRFHLFSSMFIWLVVSTYPSEKWWSSSMGRIIHDYPIYEMENKHVPNHQSDIILYPHDIPSDFLRPNNIVPWPH